MTTTSSETTTQYLFPGQAAAPPGPVDVRIMYLLHFAFRRDLTMFAAAAAVTPPDDRDAWQALEERWAFFAKTLHHHHSGEDAGLWPLLEARATAEEQVVLDAMEAEHALIDPILADVQSGFDALAWTHRAESGREVTRRLARRLRDAKECLESHLAHEETEAMAMVQTYMTQDDWERMAKEHFGKDQTLGDLLRVVPWVLHRMPESELPELLRNAGLPMRIVWYATRRRFERLEARATRHLRDAG